MKELMALSVRDPWARAMFYGKPLKDVENRRWSTDYRGDLLIHVSGEHGLTSAIIDGIGVFEYGEGSECPRCNGWHTVWLSTTNEWCYYCRTCNVRFNDKGEILEHSD